MEAHSIGGDLLGIVMIADKDRILLDTLLNELTDFARENDKERCFPKKGWTRESTKNFLHFHMNQGTLFIVRQEGKVVGIGTWWRWRKSEIHSLTDDDIFQNPPPQREDGNVLYLSDVVTTCPGAMSAMIRELVKKNPDYADLEIWGTRHNKRTGLARRVRYSRRLIDFIKEN